MPTFVLMTRLSADAMRDPELRRRMGRDWLDKVKSNCPGVKWLSHFAVLGRYDFMDIYEAPDVEAAHRVSLISRAAGAVTAESWPAMPYDEYLHLMGELVD